MSATQGSERLDHFSKEEKHLTMVLACNRL